MTIPRNMRRALEELKGCDSLIHILQERLAHERSERISDAREWLEVCIKEKHLEKIAVIMHLWCMRMEADELEDLLYAPMPNHQNIINLRELTFMHNDECYTTHFMLSLLGSVQGAREQNFHLEGERVAGCIADLSYPMRRNILVPNNNNNYRADEQWTALAFAQVMRLPCCVQWLQARSAASVPSLRAPHGINI